MKDYTPPRTELYTGVGPNVGLKLKQDAAAVTERTLGLGDEGTQSQ